MEETFLNRRHKICLSFLFELVSHTVRRESRIPISPERRVRQKQVGGMYMCESKKMEGMNEIERREAHIRLNA